MFYCVFLHALQDELRPEYEEALQMKKAKMKAQAKKKVIFFLHFCVLIIIFVMQLVLSIMLFLRSVLADSS